MRIVRDPARTLSRLLSASPRESPCSSPSDWQPALPTYRHAARESEKTRNKLKFKKTPLLWHMPAPTHTQAILFIRLRYFCASISPFVVLLHVRVCVCVCVCESPFYFRALQIFVFFIFRLVLRPASSLVSSCKRAFFKFFPLLPLLPGVVCVCVWVGAGGAQHAQWG